MQFRLGSCLGRTRTPLPSLARLGLAAALTVCPAALHAAQLLLAPTGAAFHEGLVGASPAGDFNHDGWMDFIVGTYNDAGTAGVGHAYIFFGGPGMDDVADLVLTEGGVGDNYGIVATGVGDFNGDGIDDVAVAARFAAAPQSHAGKVYVYFGSASPNGIADVEILGHAASENLGAALAPAGDVNGDGFTDLVVGGPGEGASNGSAYVYLGGPGCDGVADLTLASPESGAVFGHSVAGVGDLNNDGFDDIVVGAPYRMPAGAVYAYLGGNSPDTDADLALYGYGPARGYSNGDQFGRQVAAAGDMNDDGAPDFIVGAPNSFVGGDFAGQAYVFFGPFAGLGAQTPLTLTGSAAGDQFGSAVAGAGDMNGDCFDDVVVGAPFADDGAADAGRAMVYHGAMLPDASPDLVSGGEAGGDWFGSAVAFGGDLDGDGADELLVCAPQVDAAVENVGRAYAYGVSRAMALPFVEEWHLGILDGVWFAWGSPSPIVRAGNCTAYALDPSGDATDQSGVVSRATIDMLDRPVVTARVTVLRVGELAGAAWQNVGVGISTVDACGFGGSPRPLMLAEISLNPGLDVNELRCEVLGGTIYAEPWNPANNGACREYSIAFDEAGHVLFYRDGQLLATSPMALDLASYRAVAVNIDGRSVDTEMRVERVAVELPGFRIASVCDVPNDQGGVARIRFWDHPGDSGAVPFIVQYSGWRRLPIAPKASEPLGAPEAVFAAGIGVLSPEAAVALGFPDGWWEGVGSVAAVQRSAYSMVVPTLGDSTDAGLVQTTYVVSAHTANPAVYYVTDPMSGYSVDNLEPAPPTALTAHVAYTGPLGLATLQLAWTLSPSHDVRGHRVCHSGACVEVSSSTYEMLCNGDCANLAPQCTVAAVDYAGNLSDPVVPQELVTAVPPGTPTITQLSLGQARPNPFNPTTVIPFALPAAGQVELDVFNAAGRRVRRLVTGHVEAGPNEVVFDGKDDTGRALASGAYTYVLQAAGKHLSGSMVLIK